MWIYELIEFKWSKVAFIWLKLRKTLEVFIFLMKRKMSHIAVRIMLHGGLIVSYPAIGTMISTI